MRSKVSAVVQKGRAHGLVAGVPGGGRFELLYVDASSLVKVDDRVVSSGLGGRYPKGKGCRLKRSHGKRGQQTVSVDKIEHIFRLTVT